MDPKSTDEAESQTAHTEGPWRDSLVHLITCMLGFPVKAYLKNGSVYVGILHAVDGEKDFGITLKMASLIKDDTLGGHNSSYGSARKPPSREFFIPAAELMQLVAKDVVQSENLPKLLTDSSRGLESDEGRRGQEPYEDVTHRVDLENVFDYPEKGVRHQFESNMSLVIATRIARQTEHSRDLHVNFGGSFLLRELVQMSNSSCMPKFKQERGHQLNEESDMDDKMKYLSVRYPGGFDNSAFGEDDDTLGDTCSDQTSGGASTYDGQKPAYSSKGNVEVLVLQKDVETVMRYIARVNGQLAQKGVLIEDLEAEVTSQKKEYAHLKENYENKLLVAEKKAKVEAEFWLGEVETLKTTMRELAQKVSDLEGVVASGEKEYDLLNRKYVQETISHKKTRRELIDSQNAEILWRDDFEIQKRKVQKGEDKGKPEAVPPNNCFDKLERKLQNIGNWLLEYVFFTEVLIGFSAISAVGVIACLMAVKHASKLKKILMAVFISVWAIVSAGSLLKRQDQMVAFFRDTENRFPSMKNLLFCFAFVAVCFGFVKLTDFVEKNEWSWVAVVFYILCYIHITSLMKLLGKTDLFGTGDALITISCMLMVKLHKEGKVPTLGLIGYLFSAVFLVLFRRGKQKNKPTQNRIVKSTIELTAGGGIVV